MWLSIIFITILCTPQATIMRWSSTSPVSDEMKNQWKGFCAIIAKAYYVRGMAWLASVITSLVYITFCSIDSCILKFENVVVIQRFAPSPLTIHKKDF